MTRDTDDLWTRAEPDSPCIKVCVIHPKSRLCVGCHRTIDEISAWSSLSPDQRRDIMTVLPERARRMTTRQGGASGRRGEPG